MNKSDLLRLMNHRLREIEMLIDALQAEEAMHDIDIDLLMSKIRELYSDAKSISSVRIGTVSEPGLREDMFPESEEGEEEPAVGEEEPDMEAIEEPLHEPVEKPVENSFGVHVEAPLETQVLEKAEGFEEPDRIDEEPGSVDEEVEIKEKEEEIVEEDKGVVKNEEVIIEAQDKKVEQGEEKNKEQAKLFKEPREKLLTGIKMQAVNDIMVAIGLNDRFLFTRELFNNDSELFSSTIRELNSQGSWEDAVAYLDSRFDWDPQDPTLVLFLSFVKRRFL